MAEEEKPEALIVMRIFGADPSTVYFTCRRVAGWNGVEVWNDGEWIRLNASDYIELIEDEHGILYPKGE